MIPEGWHFTTCLLALVTVAVAKEKSVPIFLDEDNWTDMLEGEWLVKFFAPWCPACKGLVPVWEKVAGWSDDLDIKVAQVDVTANPGLSGRFLVTSLPTIYHVKNGIFRHYRGERSEEEFISLVDDKKWLNIDPVPWYSAPNSLHMAVLSYFFKISMAIRDLHNLMTSEFGIPMWGSYLVFAVATIIIGLVLGLVLVCCCDMVCPQKPAYLDERDLHPANYDDIDESDVSMDEKATDSSSTKSKDSKSSDPDHPTTARKRAPRTD